jgi:hypothetical protein
MKYLPYEDFEIHSELTSDEVFYKLRAAVDTQGKWWIFTNKPFWGEVNRHYFRIWRDSFWNRNANPVISGIIRSEDSGSYLQIRIRPPWSAIFVWVTILGLLGYGFFYLINTLIIQRITLGFWQIDPLGDHLSGGAVFVFMYFMLMIPFKMDVNQHKEFLTQLTGVDRKEFHNRDKLFGATEAQLIKFLLFITIVASLVWIGFNILL